MMLSEEAISEYQKIMKEEYGKEFSREEARECGTWLVRYFDLLLKIDQSNKHETSQKEIEQTKPDKTI